MRIEPHQSQFAIAIHSGPMPTDVVMPQMGESIAEGTIVRWIKKVGDKVDRDEPLFEISTDKVDAEIPSPAGGVVSEIRVKEGETVPVNSVVAVIGAAGRSGRRAGACPAPLCAAAAPPPRTARTTDVPQAGSPRRRRQRHVRRNRRARSEERRRGFGERSSPLVRKIAKEHNVDISQIHGTGIAGRVTKDDILGYHRADRSGRLGSVRLG